MYCILKKTLQSIFLMAGCVIVIYAISSSAVAVQRLDDHVVTEKAKKIDAFVFAHLQQKKLKKLQQKKKNKFFNLNF